MKMLRMAGLALAALFLALISFVADYLARLPGRPSHLQEHGLRFALFGASSDTQHLGLAQYHGHRPTAANHSNTTIFRAAILARLGATWGATLSRRLRLPFTGNTRRYALAGAR